MVEPTDSGATSMTAGEGGDSTGDPPSYEDYKVLCAAQLDKSGCDSVPSATKPQPEYEMLWCAWLARRIRS